MRAELEKVVRAIEAFYAREGVLFDRDLGEPTRTRGRAVPRPGRRDAWEAGCA